MAISDRVVECIKKYNADDIDNALIQLCIAINATSNKEYPNTKGVGDKFHEFVRANEDIIILFMMGGNMFINCKFGNYTVGEVIYEVIRCTLLHEGDLHKMIEFVEPGQPVSISDLRWRIPKAFIFGTLLSVIGSSTNADQSAPNDLTAEILGQKVDLNGLWGRAGLIRQIMNAPAA
jgi:hypothetical protein